MCLSLRGFCRALNSVVSIKSENVLLESLTETSFTLKVVFLQIALGTLDWEPPYFAFCDEGNAYQMRRYAAHVYDTCIVPFPYTLLCNTKTWQTLAAASGE